MINYGFWVWSKKIKGVLLLLAALADYDLWDEELEVIKEGLIGTNDENNIWMEYPIKGKKYSLDLKLAYDAEEGNDMIHVGITAPDLLKDKLEALNLFQCMVMEIEIEK